MGKLVCTVSVFLLLIANLGCLVAVASPNPTSPRYQSIFGFGNSYTDTGNSPIFYAEYSVPNPVVRPPYGSTFFGHPTGRCSDGRLIIDFIAERMGLPLVPPSLTLNKVSFRQGANFAVGGATAIDAAFFHDGSLPEDGLPLKDSLCVQLGWFEQLKPSLCHTTQGCEEFFSTSLFIVGFGINDYHIRFVKGIEEVMSIVPYVVRTITMGIESLIKHGAKSILVPGMIPSGCVPVILHYFPKDDPKEYNSTTGCIDGYNEPALHHNLLLQEAIEKLQNKHPSVAIIYGDLYGPMMDMVVSPAKFGLKEDILVECCGGPEDLVCGDDGANVCKDPSTSLFWDHTHLTETSYRYFADLWLRSIASTAIESI